MQTQGSDSFVLHVTQASLQDAYASDSIHTAKLAHIMSHNIYFFFLNEQKVGMLLQKRTDTRGVGISSTRST